MSWHRASVNHSIIWKPNRQVYEVKAKQPLNPILLYWVPLHHHNHHPHSQSKKHVLSISLWLFLSLWITQTNWPTAWCRIYPKRDSSETERGGWLGTITMGADLMMRWTSKKSLISWEILSLANNLSSKTYGICFFRKAQLDNYTQKYKYH